MPRLGLIGYPLSYSFSPSYFANKFEKGKILNWEYDAFPMASLDAFTNLWEEHPRLLGLNVTIPYKEKIIPFLDELDESAASIQAVNTIKKVGNQLIGYNTDVYGFEYSLQELLGAKTVEKALVLGTGGASKAILYVLEKMNIKAQLVSRTKKENILSYEDVDEVVLSQHHLIINTTPLGTHPDINNCPKLNYNCINQNHYLHDLVYNPMKTLFLEKGENQGAKTMNGLLMLHQQAEKSWDIWTNEPF